MSKITLITKREYLSRVKKKSFIVLTILSPLLMIAFYGTMIYFSVNRDVAEKNKLIVVNDQSGLIENKLGESKSLSFRYEKLTPEQSEKFLSENPEYYGILNIPSDFNADNTAGVELIATDQATLSTTGFIEKRIEKALKNLRLSEFNINQQIIDKINQTNVSLKTTKYDPEKGTTETAYSEASSIVGFIASFLIYIFIFLYGVQIMRGVIEEKTNRIVEVIISSVKPFELMMGKIFGIALVGLTQFSIWVVMATVSFPFISSFIYAKMGIDPGPVAQAGQTTQGNGEMVSTLMDGLTQQNYGLIIGAFLFFFLSGYLFYGALFAAIGSAVDSETDTQQFMLPVTMPLVFGIMLSFTTVLSSPNSTIAQVLSYIPFTAPVTMMVRIPFDIPAYEILISMAIMILSFLFTVWMAARIYRIGILMYGKKPSYKEIFKWIRMSA